MPIKDFIEKLELLKSSYKQNFIYECCGGKYQLTQGETLHHEKMFYFRECPNCFKQILLYEGNEIGGKFINVGKYWIYDPSKYFTGIEGKEIVAKTQTEILALCSKWDSYEIINKHSQIILTNQEEIDILNDIISLFSSNVYVDFSEKYVNLLKENKLYDIFCKIYINYSIEHNNSLNEDLHEIKVQISKLNDYLGE